jgi:two-component system sensor histidine kinase MprB
MPLRRRITLVAATTVACAVAIAILISYFAVRNQLYGQINSELRGQAAQIQTQGRGTAEGHQPPSPGPGNGGSAPYVDFVTAAGVEARAAGDLTLPDKDLAMSVAAGTVTGPVMVNVTVEGAHLRMYIFSGQAFDANLGEYVNGAWELARPLSSDENVLSTLRWVLAVIFLAVVALAAGLARLATRRVMEPLARVTATAQLIGETDDLTQRIDVRSDDEVGQLADRFNEMLERLETSRGALDASVTSQRQLVADASHELRTPVTSLRTNIEVLLSGAELEHEDRQRLLADVVEQCEELSSLVSDLIEVARGDSTPESIEELRLDRLVEDALDRARRNAPYVEFRERLSPVLVRANPERLLRVVNNLLDNAALHGGQGGPVEVTVDNAGLIVRDHGEGVAEADLPFVFDRFYRGANSRSRQGSGLGLAIVRQTVEQLHGSVTASNAEDGGAVFTLVLPTEAIADQQEQGLDALHATSTTA